MRLSALWSGIIRFSGFDFATDRFWPRRKCKGGLTVPLGAKYPSFLVTFRSSLFTVSRAVETLAYGGMRTAARDARREGADGRLPDLRRGQPVLAYGEQPRVPHAPRQPRPRQGAAAGCEADSGSPMLCPRCGSQMRLIAVITNPAEVRKILRHLLQIGRAPPGQASRRSGSRLPLARWAAASFRGLQLEKAARRECSRQPCGRRSLCNRHVTNLRNRRPGIDGSLTH